MTPDDVRKLRAALKMTQEQLAEAIGSERVTVARWETGKHEPRGGYLKTLRELQAKAKKKSK